MKPISGNLEMISLISLRYYLYPLILLVTVLQPTHSASGKFKYLKNIQRDSQNPDRLQWELQRWKPVGVGEETERPRPTIDGDGDDAAEPREKLDTANRILLKSFESNSARGGIDDTQPDNSNTIVLGNRTSNELSHGRSIIRADNIDKTLKEELNNNTSSTEIGGQNKYRIDDNESIPDPDQVRSQVDKVNPANDNSVEDDDNELSLEKSAKDVNNQYVADIVSSITSTTTTGLGDEALSNDVNYTNSNPSSPRLSGYDTNDTNNGFNVKFETPGRDADASISNDSTSSTTPNLKIQEEYSNAYNLLASFPQVHFGSRDIEGSNSSTTSTEWNSHDNGSPSSSTPKSSETDAVNESTGSETTLDSSEISVANSTSGLLPSDAGSVDTNASISAFNTTDSATNPNLHERSNHSETLSSQSDLGLVNLNTTENPCEQEMNFSSVEFEDLVSAKGPVEVGKSYNGLNVTEISKNIPGDGKFFEYTLTVEIVNHIMNRSIATFQLHDPHNATYFMAPELIRPNTKEVFTLREPSCCFPTAAFSFEVMGTPHRVVAYGQSSYFSTFGIAFLPMEISLQDYYSNKTSYGKFVQRWQMKNPSSIVVARNNFNAKATMRGAFRSILTVEIIESLQC